MNEVLALIIALLVYPGLLFGLVAAAALGWLRGTARSLALGWPVARPLFAWNAVNRRLRQASSRPEGVTAVALQALPVIAAVCPLLVLVFLPLPGNRGANQPDYTLDIAAAGGLVLGMPIARVVLGWAIPSPYTRIAAMRTARAVMGAAVPLALALATGAVLGGALRLSVAATATTALNTQGFAVLARLAAGAAYLTCLPLITRLTPTRQGAGALDAVAGELTELSGRELLVMRVAEWLQLVAALGLGIALFVLPFFHTDAARLIAALVAAIVGAVGLGVWEGVLPRIGVREDLPPPLATWTGAPILFGVFAVLFLILAQRTL